MSIKQIKKFKNNILDTLKRFFPAVLSGGIFQINILVDTILATLVGFGAVSFLYYSDRIIQLPLGIIGVSLGTVLLSSISHPKVINNNKKISNQLIIAIKISLYFFTFCILHGLNFPKHSRTLPNSPSK